MNVHLTPVAACVAAALALAPPLARAADRTVTTCANQGNGSLRAAINSAASGDRIVFDTQAMNCSTITLTSGQIAIGVQELTIQGPTDSTLTVGGFNSSRVFLDYGDRARKLTINNLTIANGYYEVPYATGDEVALGGCILTSGELVLNSSVVTGCRVAMNVGGNIGAAVGGGVAAFKLRLVNSSITDNEAHAYSIAFGGGAWAHTEMIVQASRITGNSANGGQTGGFGGGLASLPVFSNYGGDVRISFSTIADNHSDAGGGGVSVSSDYAARSLTIDHSTISGNSVGKRGGGVFAYATYEYPMVTVAIDDSTIYGNSSEETTGGIYHRYGPLTIRNSTIAGNTALSGVFNMTYSAAAGLFTTGATLQSTIIAKNRVLPNTGSDLNGIGGPSITGADNLIAVTLPGTNAPPGTLTQDPMFGALANFGGATAMLELLPGSPALAAGNNVARLSSDQRGPGFARATNGKVDIGAWQSGDGYFSDGFD
jgi:hypothetical protein